MGRDTTVMRYRFYFFTHENIIADTIDVECETDEQAMATRLEQAEGRRIEIWQRHRRVGVFDAPEAAATNCKRQPMTAV